MKTSKHNKSLKLCIEITGEIKGNRWKESTKEALKTLEYKTIF